jgi:hypothetical protein
MFRSEVYSPYLSAHETFAAPSGPSLYSPDKSSHLKPGRRIKPTEELRSQPEPLPEGCVDLFVAESESSEDDSDSGSQGGKNVWRKMKGRLKSDLNDFTTNGRRV